MKTEQLSLNRLSRDEMKEVKGGRVYNVLYCTNTNIVYKCHDSTSYFDSYGDLHCFGSTYSCYGITT